MPHFQIDWTTLADTRVLVNAESAGAAVPTANEGIELRAGGNWPQDRLPRFWTLDIDATGTGALTFLADLWGKEKGSTEWQNLGSLNSGSLFSGSDRIGVSEVVEWLGRFERIFLQLLSPTGTSFSLDVRLSPNV